LVTVGVRVNVLLLVGVRSVLVGETVKVGENIMVEVDEGVNVGLGEITPVVVRVLVPVTGINVFVATKEFSVSTGVGELFSTTSSFWVGKSVAVGIGC